MEKTEKTLRIAIVVIGELLALGTALSLLTSGDYERLLLSFGTMVLVLLPGLVEHFFGCKINTVVYIFTVLYATGPMMGHCWKFYYTIPCWDRLLHLCGGVVFAILGCYLFDISDENLIEELKGKSEEEIYDIILNVTNSPYYETELKIPQRKFSSTVNYDELLLNNEVYQEIYYSQFKKEDNVNE